MTDVKYKRATSFDIGYSAAEKTAIGNIIELKDKIVAPDGELVRPFAAINDKTPADVTHHGRYILVELITDGWNYEAIMEQQVVTGESASRALRQGADNDPIGYMVGTFEKPGAAEDTVTYESGRGYLSGLHLHVSNRKGIKYQPVTQRFKVRGNRT